jgi:hypothetical protein
MDVMAASSHMIIFMLILLWLEMRFARKGNSRTNPSVTSPGEAG